MQEQAASSIAASSLPSTSERSSSSALHVELREGMETDDDIRRDLQALLFTWNSEKVTEAETAGPTSSSHDGGSAAGPVQPSAGGPRRRGRSPDDKESKRLKGLLRNRVSAQQARERTMAYLNHLEAEVTELETKNGELQVRLSTMQNENQMLRQILKKSTVVLKREENS